MSLILNILSLRSKDLLSPPQTSTNHTANSKQHTKRNTEAPDTLHLVAGSLASTSPDPVIDLTQILADGIDK